MILILGGTSESISICKLLDRMKMRYYISVTTAYGSSLYEAFSGSVLEGKLSEEAMQNLIKKLGITCIIDATHPYAVEVSKNAIASAGVCQVKYVRYERPSLLDEVLYEKVHVVGTTNEAIEKAKETKGKIFLSTGSKTLEQFACALQKEQIIARVLPTSEVLGLCEQLGLLPEQIIAMKGPFSEAMNELTYKEYGIGCVITKESGYAGGFLEKINACKKLGIDVIVIKRSTLAYPQVVQHIDALGKWLDT